MLRKLKGKLHSFLNDKRIRRAAIVAKAFRDTETITAERSRALQSSLSQAAFLGGNSPYSKRLRQSAALPDVPLDGDDFAELCSLWDIPYGAKILIVGEIGRDFFDAISRKRPDAFLWTFDPMHGLFPNGPLHWAKFDAVIFPATAGHFDLAQVFFACSKLLRNCGTICVFDYTSVNHPSYYLSHVDYRVRALSTWTGLAREAGYNYSAVEQGSVFADAFSTVNGVRVSTLVARFSKEKETT